MPIIALARIDDRLIHGQVVIKWLRVVPVNEIVICDDDVRADPFLQRVLSLAKPPQVRLLILSIAEAIAYLRAPESESPASDGATPPHDTRVILLVKAPATARALLEGGVHLDKLNVGGIAASPGSKRIYKSVSVTAEQLNTLQHIQRMGVRVILQTVPEPEETAVALESLNL